MRHLTILTFITPFILAYGNTAMNVKRKRDALWRKDNICNRDKANCSKSDCENQRRTRKAHLSKLRPDYWYESFKVVIQKCQPTIDTKYAEDSTEKSTVCIMMNAESLGKPRKAEFNRHIQDHLPGIKKLIDVFDRASIQV